MQNISAATERNKNDDAMDVDDKVIIHFPIWGKSKRGGNRERGETMGRRF